MLTRRKFLVRGSFSTFLAAGFPRAMLASSVSARAARVRYPRSHRIDAADASERQLLPPIPRLNGAINVQPVRKFEPTPGFDPPLIVPELVDAQLRLLYELGFERIRITLPFDSFGFGPDFLGSIPYVRGARALGIDVLGIIGQFGFGFDLVQALSNPELRGPVLDVYLGIFNRDVEPASPVVERPGSFSFQVLNEPSNQLGLMPGDYVRFFLAPVNEHLKDAAPDLLVVSAAPVGTLTGVQRVREMLLAGLENHCDRVAYHLYRREAIPHFAGLAHRPVWVTESGTVGPENHLAWLLEVFDEIRTTIREVEHIYYFDLFDLDPMKFRIVEIVEGESGFHARVESLLLHEHFLSRVDEAVMGRPHAPYKELIPDIAQYLPAEDDLELIASVPFDPGIG